MRTFAHFFAWPQAIRHFNPLLHIHFSSTHRRSVCSPSARRNGVCSPCADELSDMSAKSFVTRLDGALTRCGNWPKDVGYNRHVQTVPCLMWKWSSIQCRVDYVYIKNALNFIGRFVCNCRSVDLMWTEMKLGFFDFVRSIYVCWKLIKSYIIFMCIHTFY